MEDINFFRKNLARNQFISLPGKKKKKKTSRVPGSRFISAVSQGENKKEESIRRFEEVRGGGGLGGDELEMSNDSTNFRSRLIFFSPAYSAHFPPPIPLFK